MPRRIDQRELAGLLRKAKRVVLTTHTRPDADGLGTELAIVRVLKRMGKTCHILNATPAARNLDFLQKKGEIRIYEPERDAALLNKAGVIMAIDVGCADKMDRLKAPIMASPATRVLMDHHVRRDKEFDLHWVREDISSSGEMGYLLLRALAPKLIGRDVATPLYTAIAHDTGNFNYDRTSAETFRIASDLVARGAKPYEVFKAKQCARTEGQLRFIGEALSRLRMSPSRKVAWCAIPHDMLRRYNVDEYNIPRVIDILLTIGSIEVALVLIEIAPERIKGSARSKSYVDVSAMAQNFNGGGHRKSSGFSLRASLTDAEAKVSALAEAAATRRR